jgi:outer membrane lipoprotein-sorting protein
MNKLARIPVLFLLCFTVGLSGCLFRSHKVEKRLSTAQLKSATQQELIDRLNNEAAKIKTLNMTVDIATSVGGEKKGKVTDFKEIRGYVLVRKPSMLRLIGLMPIVRNKAFDMVSNGNEFKLWVPPTNKFYVGPRDVVYKSPNPLENLRPQVFYDALMFREIDPETEIAVVESGLELAIDPKTKKQVDQPDYHIDVIRKGPHGWYLSRKIIFSRVDLQPHEQQIFDTDGNLVTDAKYSDLKDYNGITFPNVIEITRPQEEYSITMSVVKLRINEPITDEQFALAQPQNATIVRLDQPRTAKGGDGQTAAASSTPSDKKSDNKHEKKNKKDNGQGTTSAEEKNPK